jgi:hypothetical protein
MFVSTPSFGRMLPHRFIAKRGDGRQVQRTLRATPAVLQRLDVPLIAT